jgi:plasmid stabilization system protein ParE
MRNTCEIIWSTEAKKNLNTIVEYLEDKWTNKEISKFLSLLNHTLELLRQKPFLFQSSYKFKNIRKAVITSQVSLFYKVNKSSIMIVSLFDNRQHPDKLKI